MCEHLGGAGPEHGRVALVVFIEDAAVGAILEKTRAPRHGGLDHLVAQRQQQVARAC